MKQILSYLYNLILKELIPPNIDSIFKKIKLLIQETGLVFRKYIKDKPTSKT